MKKSLYLLTVLIVILAPTFVQTQTWIEVTNLGTTQSLNGVFFLDDNNGWIAADSCLIFKTTDGGNSWQKIHIGSSTEAAYPLDNVQFVTIDTGFAAGDSGYVYVSYNGGISWSAIDSSTTGFIHKDINGIHFKNGYEGWIVGASGSVSHTMDGGITWTYTDTITSWNLHDVEFFGNIGWVIGDNMAVFNTYDNGNSWQNQGGSFSGHEYEIDVLDANYAYIAGGGSSPYIYKTTNTGVTWTSQTGPSQYMATIAMKDTLEGWVGGMDGEIVYTSDGGTTWTLDNSGTNNFFGNFQGLAYQPSGRVWAVGSSGKIFKTAAGATAPTVTLTMTDTLVDPGQVFYLPLYISGADTADSILSFEMKISTDTSKLQLMEIDTTGSLVSHFMIDTHFISIDTFKLVGSRADPFSGNGTFLKFKFMVSPDAPSLDTITVDLDTFFFNEGMPNVTINPGTVHTTGPLYGDVSLNGSINSADASLILQYRVDKITLSDTAQTAAEVSNNGTISAFDAALILRYAAGYITHFPVGYMFMPKETFSNSFAYLKSLSDNDKFAEYVICLDNAKDMYAAEILLDYSGMEFMSFRKTEGTNDFMVESIIKNGRLACALAGTQPVNNSGEILILKFKKLSDQPSVALNTIIVNETEIIIGNQQQNLLPETYELHQNYPNPFNSETIITYQLPEAGKVDIAIYNFLGQKVRTLVNNNMNAGYHQIKWNGRNDRGSSVASGIYIVKIKANNYTKTRKAIYLR